MSGIDAKAVALLYDARRRNAAFRPPLRAYLSRPFPRGDLKRVLLIHMEHDIALPQYYAFFRYSERFAEKGYVFRTARYPAAGVEHLVKEASAIFVQAPYEVGEGEIERLLERLKRENPHASISFFDWFAPTDVRFGDRVGGYVDFYAKKSLLRDRGYYRVPQNSHTMLEERYCAVFDLIPDVPTWDCNPAIVDKLVLSPGFATAPSLLEGFERRSEPPSGERPIQVHARFGFAPAVLRTIGRLDAGKRTHWYAAMRQQAYDTVVGMSGRYQMAWQGHVKADQFMSEMARSQLCFSPFGFGELCWRDLEAVLTGAVLIKPDMSHLECFCDIYQPGETYVPVRWDLADLDETIARLLAQPDECRAIAARAFDRIKAYLAGPRIGQFLDRIAMPAQG